MRTILVPVDNSSAIENAVDFAAEWAGQYGYDHIILLKTSNESMFDYFTIADGYALVNEEDLNRQLQDTETILKNLTGKIREKSSAIKVTTAISQLPLLRSVINLVKNDKSVELIVLGSDHTSDSNDSFVAENIIDIARVSPVKTLIVPDSYHFEGIRNILVPCDISRMTNLERLSKFRDVIKQKDVQLKLLNIHADKGTANIALKKKWEEKIHQYLEGIPYNIYYSYDKNIINGILSFTASNDVDLLIALPGEHSFLYYLTNRSISEGLYKNADQAVLILK